MYAMSDGDGDVKKLQYICEFVNSGGVGIGFSYISYMGGGSAFDVYTRK